MKNNKKGFTLIEVLAATIILAIISTSIIYMLTFSRTIVQTSSTKDAYAAEVQAASDAIMCYINSKITNGNDISKASKSSRGENNKYVYCPTKDDFNKFNDNIQFTIEEPSDDTSDLYKITTRIYYGSENKREMSELICFSHKGW
ncbi:type II secretion system protein [Anaerovorax odorimutans]|uniref:type II secretion system protein n=1 Tax=Anaerovorax odorimutans TaxID=109327 RepID=UPI00040327D9|nr:type II secretion system protein [Anaerovorax odorimutans]